VSCWALVALGFCEERVGAQGAVQAGCLSFFWLIFPWLTSDSRLCIVDASVASRALQAGQHPFHLIVAARACTECDSLQVSLNYR
jgi:ABC-type uncharacterized transport system permease subunit